MLLRIRTCTIAVAVVWAFHANASVEPRLLSLDPCQFTASGDTVEAECGWIAVPETYGAATDTEIQLPFVRFKSTSPKPGAPLVYLAGGPGGSGIGVGKSQRFHLFMKLREASDVILLDQRGTGDAKPSLDYAETWDFPLDRPADFDAWKPIAERKLAECSAFFRAKGVDLGHYNTKESAADVDALRRVLGLDKVSLWGTSYGTHLALATVRYHGPGLDRVILSGVESPDCTLKLPSITEEYFERVCREASKHPEVAKKIPDLLALARQLLDRLAKEPARAVWRDSTILLGPLDVQIYISEAVGRRRSVGPLPIALYEADHGNFGRIAGMAYAQRAFAMGNAMSLAMDAASGASPGRLNQIFAEDKTTVVGNAMNFPFDRACSKFGVPDLGDEFRGPLTSDVPTLFITGTLDARTPTINAEETRRGFKTSYHILVENAGHDEDLFSLAPGLGDRMVAFLRGEAPSEERIVYEPLTFAPIP